MKWVDFSAHNAKIQLRNAIEVKYLVVTPLQGFLDARVTDAFTKLGFEHEDDKLVTKATRSLWDKLCIAKGVKIIDVNPTDIEESRILCVDEQAINEKQSSLDAGHYCEQQDVQREAEKPTAKPNQQDSIDQSKISDVEKLAVELSKQFYSHIGNISENQSGIVHGIEATIILTSGGSNEIRARAILWHEHSEPRIAFMRGEYHKVIGLTDKQGECYFNFDIIKNSVSLPITYISAFDRLKANKDLTDNSNSKHILSIEKNDGKTKNDDAPVVAPKAEEIAHKADKVAPRVLLLSSSDINDGIAPNARGEFKTSDSEEISYKTIKTTAYIRTLKYDNEWLATYGYIHNQGNYLCAAPPITTASEKHLSKDNAMLGQLDMLIASQSSILNTSCSQSQKKEAQGVIDWARELVEQINASLSENREQPSNQL